MILRRMDYLFYKRDRCLIVWVNECMGHRCKYHFTFTLKECIEEWCYGNGFQFKKLGKILQNSPNTIDGEFTAYKV